MKSQPVLLLALCFCSSVALLADTEAPKAPQPDAKTEATPEKSASSSETLVIHLQDDVTVRFKAEIITKRENTDKAVNDCGFFTYQGQLYAGISSTPHRILTSGSIEIDGRTISLDVSGIANPWVNPDDLARSHIYLTSRLDGSHSDKVTGNPGKRPGERHTHLEVHFEVGGDGNYLAAWDILGGLSLRTSLKEQNSPPYWETSRIDEMTPEDRKEANRLLKEAETNSSRNSEQK